MYNVILKILKKAAVRVQRRQIITTSDVLRHSGREQAKVLAVAVATTTTQARVRSFQMNERYWVKALPS